mmetsp:Transcript_117677/g.377608  ORF Transcript_117677/g.377608 Transcript_117677/m.377608 type:complete len:80 (+) Transcript_117677:440-679(+)
MVATPGGEGERLAGARRLTRRQEGAGAPSQAQSFSGADGFERAQSEDAAATACGGAAGERAEGSSRTSPRRQQEASATM